MSDFLLLLVLWMGAAKLFTVFPSKLLLWLLFTPFVSWALYRLVRLVQRAIGVSKP